MLFNSYIFIFAFFPIVFWGFFRIGAHNQFRAALWLAAASLFFYAWWDIRFIGLLLGSIAFNYCAGYFIAHRVVRSPILLKFSVGSAIASNLILLGYFKYTNFFAENLNFIANMTLPITEYILPLGISFFTFTQIAFLVDTSQGKVKDFNFVRYTLFVTYFPHLIAGPVLHHQEMMPQFASRRVYRMQWKSIAPGLTIFVLGLAKKVLIADSLIEFSTPVFSAAASGEHIYFLDAWVGALAYTLQLYFDFSAYSDMAIGLSLMLNVRLPMNFNSPYKALSIIEFWKRWHMSLSRFLRDYLYIPLGGNRNGKNRRYLNLMVTMLIGGLWHGASWTFIAWGGLHGAFLIANHTWREIKQKMQWGNGGRLTAIFSGTLTFLAVVIGWVFFRADSISSAVSILQGMTGINGLLTKWAPSRNALLIIVPCMIFVFVSPNIGQIFKRYRPTCDEIITAETTTIFTSSTSPDATSRHEIAWSPTKYSAAAIIFLLAMSIGLLNRTSVFLYFQF